MKKRLVISKEIRLSMFLLIASFILSFLILHVLDIITVYAADFDKESDYKIIIVEKGDSVWSIARKYIDQSPYDDLRYYSYIISLENNLKDYNIVPNQSLRLPIGR